MFTGWGLSYDSDLDGGYHPLGYHRGTVWPHDTAFAAEAFSYQLPELFAGFRRDDTAVPVEYADALKPQSWAAGTPLLLLRTPLGLEAVDGRLRSRPHLPPGIKRLRLRNVRVGD